MTPPFKPSGIITLTTDFGQQDPFVAVMKGSILTRFPSARLIDLTHEIVVHWPAEAGFWLARSFEYFPPGTVHAAVVDPGVGTAREIVIVSARGHVLVAPDNGLLAPVVARCDDASTVRLAPAVLTELKIDRVSPTFHGRDIFAPIAAELAAGRRSPQSLGPPANALIPSWVEEPETRGGQIIGTVITIDHFGNLITNIDAGLVKRFQEPAVRAGSHTFKLLRTYGDVRPGEYLALINAFEVLEIACAERSAAESLGLNRGAPVVVEEGARRG